MAEPKIILIGNGPSAIANKHGAAIDRNFTDVIRFKDAPLGGKFAEFVGTRTTTIVRGDSKPMDVPKRVQVVRVAPASNINRFGRQVTVLPRRIDGINYPSLGLVMIDRLIGQGLAVSLLGFDLYDPKVARRYWEDGKGPKHDHETESAWLLAKMQSGYVIKFLEPPSWMNAKNSTT